MFPFDPNSLPHVTTRKALLAIDFQADFLPTCASNLKDAPYIPALPITHPADSEKLTDNVVALADHFRQAGNIVCWVDTELLTSRPAETELPNPSGFDGHGDHDGTNADDAQQCNGRGRSPRSHDSYPDAFLSPASLCRERHSQRGNRSCVLPSTPGSAFHPCIQSTINSHPCDLRITKSYYSAFKCPELLRKLRGSFVTELFICGPLTNVGVYATAIDAAGYGYDITLVETCCGWTNQARRDAAVRDLIEITGCELLTDEDVVSCITKKAKTKDPMRTSSSAGLARTMNALTLDDKNPLRHDNHQRNMDSKNEGGRATHEQGENESNLVPRGEGQQEGKGKVLYKLEPDICGGGAHQRTKEGQARAGGDSDPQLTPAEEVTPLGEVDISTTGSGPESAKTIGPAGHGTYGASIENESGLAHRLRLPSSCASASYRGDKASLSPINTPVCEGDTMLIPHLLPLPLADTIFHTLLGEVKWDGMSHLGGEVPRLVAVQGSVDSNDGCIPVYRHPADSSPPLLPFSPCVLVLKQEVEKKIGHDVNHVLIQHYRTGSDFISEHSDKTLDIVPDSYICNVSLGAERVMVLRTKKDVGINTGSNKRSVIRVALPHNSLFKMGLKTNMKWLHAIRQDKRPDTQKTAEERVYPDGRISLTFRHIGTFLSADQSRIWGQGATSKSSDGARAVINGQGLETVRMLRAFGSENHDSDFDWNQNYGQGFDVLHMRTAPRLFAGADPVANMRVALMIAECGIFYAEGSGAGVPEPAFCDEPSSLPNKRPVRLCDADTDGTIVEGDFCILWYLDSHYYKPSRGRTQHLHGQQLAALDQGNKLLQAWRVYRRDETNQRRDIALFQPFLARLEGLVADHRSPLNGREPNIADFGVWPVLHAMVQELGENQTFDGFNQLHDYYGRLRSRESVAKVLSDETKKDKVP